MNKDDAVATLGGSTPGWSSLLQPARLRAALSANDRLKLYLSVLQASAVHARQPHQASLDLAREIAAAGIGVREEADWLHDLPATAALDGEAIRLPDLPRLLERLKDDLSVMARPLLAPSDADPELMDRVSQWQQRLMHSQGELLTPALLSDLTRGQGDSLHTLVMTLHKGLNQLAARLATESVAGAHAWDLAADGSDHPRVEAFMRGLARTRALKLSHPGLDTSVTREGPRLMIQNDIGTNDAHVLVLQVDTSGPTRVSMLTYSDLHRQRFAFFQDLLSEAGAQWSPVQSRQTPGFNEGEAYHVGVARFEAHDEAALLRQLESVGERIVFLIDWNRARKKLQPFVDKPGAMAVLKATAAQRVGHMAWLSMGADRLIWNAMAEQGGNAFRLGDRLDEVLGEQAAESFLVEALTLAHRAALAQQSASLVADEVRALLARRLQGRHGEFDELQEHAGLCHALAQGLRDALAHGGERDAQAAAHLAARAKTWERQADHLVMRARAQSERHPQWLPLVRLIERSDDVADALEEASFILSLLADHHEQARRVRGGWTPAVAEAMSALADSVLGAVQDHVKALAVARTLGEGSDAGDHDEFLAASWRVLQAERQGDELLRAARRALAASCRELNDAVALTLGNELAAALEQASDALLTLGYGVRERVFLRLDSPGA